MLIRILPDAIASAIAAGEVIERPESVVKELIENALDAGASQIQIEVAAGGRELIEVADDGSGIPAEEAPLAMHRHATSKLAELDDLFAIRSLGFRGEALASIAAVSRVEMITRSEDQDRGVLLRVEAGQVSEPIQVGTPVGTQVRVKDLFFNVPARRKFLKTEHTERRRITTLVTRYALAYPQVRFRLQHDGREAFQSAGRGDRRTVLAEIFDPEIARQMLALPEAGDRRLALEGFISPPAIHRSNRRELTFFVNGRWVQDGSLSAAVLRAYHTLLMVGRFPIVVLFLDMAPEKVDVNVHPAKSEVRFADPSEVFGVVQRVLRARLLGGASAPAFQLGAGWLPAARQPTSRMDDISWGGITESVAQPMDQPGLPTGDVPLLRPIGQVGAAYLVAEGPDGLYLIDQHAAHERVLFEKWMRRVAEARLEAQAYLEPQSVTLSPAQVDLLQGQLKALTHLGFDVEPFGPGTFQVRAVPGILAHLSASEALRVLVEDFEEDESPLADELEARVAARVCKRAAIKAGQILALSEQAALIRDLEACDSPRTCPHGRPTMVHISVDSLERQFGRRGPY